jgi:hypothetical protein
MTTSDFRTIALSLPNAVAGAHHGHADFRVSGKIFATLSLEDEGYGVLLLSAEQQEEMIKDAPEIFSAVPNEWGKKGSTRVHLESVTPDVLEGALRTAWKRRMTKNKAARH